MSIEDSFVLFLIFLGNIIFPHSAELSLTKMLHLCQIMPMFWSRWFLFSMW